MKKKILTTVLLTMAIIGAFTAGKTQTTTDMKDYIECDSVETFYIDINDELHIIANNGNEYVFAR